VARLLDSLSQARAEYAGWSEVVIVDSSSEPERSLVRASCERADARHLDGSRNVREKRNLGASAAAGSHLLFVDSDCVVASDLLALHVAAWSRSELVPDGARIVGAVGVTQFVGRQTLATMAAERSPFTLAFSAARHAPFVPWATMSNTSIDRAAFLEAGGFAEDLPGRLGGDDTDLTWRLTRSGQLLASAPDAVVEHGRRTWSRPRDVLGRVWRWGRMTHHLERRHADDLITVLPSAASVGVATGLVVACLHVAGISVAAVVPAAAAALVVLSTARRMRECGLWGVSSSLLESVFVAGLWCEGLRRGRPASPIRRLHLALPAPLPDGGLEHLARRQVWDGWALAVAALTVLAWA
jgi:hypothetical protein